MIQVKCKWCGKPMLIQSLTDRRKFCSRQCFLLDRQKAYTVEDDVNVVMPPLEHICDEGFVNLTTAIIQQARDDVMQNAPGSLLREDAEAFFLSETFYEMTNLDGFDILCKLQDKYDEKQWKKKSYHRQKVRCIDTGVAYDSIANAAKAYNCSPKSIYNVCKGFSSRAAGVRFEYVEG